MISPHEWKQITRLVHQMANVILSGKTAGTDGVKALESIETPYPGHPTIDDRPVAHPYGMVSRAVKGTVQVTARQGDHPANRLVLMHRDKDRPTLENEGEVMLYDAFGNRVHMRDHNVDIGGGLRLPKKAAREGDQIKITADTDNTFIQLLATITSALNLLGASLPTPPPTSVTGKITTGSSYVNILGDD